MVSIESSGKSVREAIEDGLKKLNKSLGEVEVKILSQGGLLRKAKVLITVSGEEKESEELNIDYLGTKRQRSEAELQEREKRYQSYSENIKIPDENSIPVKTEKPQPQKNRDGRDNRDRNDRDNRGGANRNHDGKFENRGDRGNDNRIKADANRNENRNGHTDRNGTNNTGFNQASRNHDGKGENRTENRNGNRNQERNQEGRTEGRNENRSENRSENRNSANGDKVNSANRNLEGRTENRNDKGNRFENKPRENRDNHNRNERNDRGGRDRDNRNFRDRDNRERDNGDEERQRRPFREENFSPLNDEATQKAQNFLSGALNGMGIAHSLQTSTDGNQLSLGIVCESGAAIGYRGETLSALEYLTCLCTSSGNERYKIAVDCNGYKEKREQSLVVLAERMAAKALKTGRKVVLEPMSSSSRKVIHSILAENDKLITRSEGNEPNRRIVILPKRQRGKNQGENQPETQAENHTETQTAGESQE